MNKMIDISIPRWMYWDDEVESSLECPKCKSQLHNEYHSYLVKIDNEAFMVGNDAGHFCSQCPVVVLNRDAFEGGMMDQANNIGVAGIINLDEIPDENQHLELGEEGNPIPLVEFLNYRQAPVSAKKIGRNEPCPCGSGKKYKKCCLPKGKFIA